MNGAQVSGEAPRGREATRARLLDAAAEVFAEVGMGGASVEAICERAGFTRGAFYSNFSSKEEMFLELAVRVARERTAGVHEALKTLDVPIDPGNIAPLLRALGGDFHDEHFRTLLNVEISAQAMRDPGLAEAVREEGERLSGEVVQMVTEVIARGSISLRVPAEEAAYLILAVWTSTTQAAVIARQTPDELAETCTLAVSSIVRLLME